MHVNLWIQIKVGLTLRMLSKKRRQICKNLQESRQSEKEGSITRLMDTMVKYMEARMAGPEAQRAA